MLTHTCANNLNHFLCLPNETFAYLKPLVLLVNSIHFCFSSLTKKETDQKGLHSSMVYKCIKYTITAVSYSNYDPETGGQIVGILTNQIFPTCTYRHSCKSCLVTTHPCSTFLFLFFLYALGCQTVYIVVGILNLIWTYSNVKTTYLSTFLNSLIFKGSATGTMC